MISIIGLIRNFHVPQLYKRDIADQNARPSNPIPPHVPDYNALMLPTTKEGHSDCANSSALSPTAVSGHASDTLTFHGGDHIPEKPDGNPHEPPPVLPAPAIPPTSCSPFAVCEGGHSPDLRNVAGPSMLRLPASTTTYLPLAESKRPASMSSLPCRPDTRNPEHSQPLHTTIAPQVPHGSDVGGDALSSRTNDLPVEPADHSTIGGEVAREVPRVPTSASTATAPSGTSAADNLLSLPSLNACPLLGCDKLLGCAHYCTSCKVMAPYCIMMEFSPPSSNIRRTDSGSTAGPVTKTLERTWFRANL